MLLADGCIIYVCTHPKINLTNTTMFTLHNHTKKLMTRLGILSAGAIVIAASATSTQAGSTFVDTAAPEPAGSSFSDWWEGKYFTGDWFGVRDVLEDHGLKFKGKYYGAYFGVVDSQRGSRGFWDQGVEFGAELNFGKLFNNDGLKGLQAFSDVRWRDSRIEADPNQFVLANSMFNPSNWISGVQWRITNFGLQYKTGNMFAVKDLFTLRGGWLQPQKEFINQPLSKLFLNNAINSAKGIGGNIPFSSSFSTWGGTLEIKPVDWHYVKGGLFMSYPRGTDSRNHGLAFAGFAQDPSQNGLMGMLETGFTPKLGTDELPGKYAAGAYYFGSPRNSFFGTPYSGQYGFYWQADQMLFRESSPYVEEPAPTFKKGASSAAASSKSFKAPVSYSKPELSNQGLSMFNLVTFAPKYNNLFPFYFQSGLVYEGLIPTRDKDQTMFAIGYGSYSYYNTVARQNRGRAGQDYTMVLEWGYRFQANKWLFIQPFAQYIIRPNGTDNVQNATVLGFATGLTF